MCDIIYTERTESNSASKIRKGEIVMDNITKALQDLAKAVKGNDTVERVKVTITLKKPKSSKAKTKDDKSSSRQRGGNRHLS